MNKVTAMTPGSGQTSTDRSLGTFRAFRRFSLLYSVGAGDCGRRLPTGKTLAEAARNRTASRTQNSQCRQRQSWCRRIHLTYRTYGQDRAIRHVVSTFKKRLREPVMLDRRSCSSTLLSAQLEELMCGGGNGAAGKYFSHNRKMHNARKSVVDMPSAGSQIQATDELMEVYFRHIPEDNVNLVKTVERPWSNRI